MPLWLPIQCAFKEVVLAFDADDPGEEATAKMAPILEALGAKVRRLTPEGAKDWNKMLEKRGVEELRGWLCLKLLG